MLAAIGELAATPPASAQPTLAEPKPQEAAERRQVTVMFSDLVGSTALSARMDPEDLREVISAYQKCVAETVRRFGGFVAKYMGDGVLVYFGYPEAHEDDAERAVRGRIRADRGRKRTQCTGFVADARRHCHWISGRGRSDRIGSFSGTSHSRRDAEPCSAPARGC
jgi:class 3 adenylate cyclase